MLVTIGLEVHCQLNTKTKIFCGCAVQFAAPANSFVCPVCLGLPGALPVLNREVFLLGLRAAVAFNCTPSKRIKFDRKNYFYPDLPKGYQISQFDQPIGQGGYVEIEKDGAVKKIRLNRIHLEEDAGKLLHDQSPDSSFVDLNRAGTPLIEIVSEPDLETAEDASDYLNNLKAVLKSIGVSECDMEKGHLRCDANISVRKEKSDPLGKKVEVKNMNSFKAVRAAIQYEIKRQTESAEKGEKIPQETRLWDDGKAKTFPMRSKEDAHDYRYFPEPDLVPFSVSDEEIKNAKDSLPELPKQKKERFIKDYELSSYDAVLLSQDRAMADFFEKTSSLSKNPKGTANWIIGPVFQYTADKNTSIEKTQLTPELLTALYRLVQDGAVSFQAAKEKIFPDVIEKGLSPEKLIEEKGLRQVSDDSSLEAWIQEAIAANPKVVEEFRSGKESTAMFFVGQVMKKSQGKANPAKVQELVRKQLKS